MFGMNEWTGGRERESELQIGDAAIRIEQEPKERSVRGTCRLVDHNARAET